MCKTSSYFSVSCFRHRVIVWLLLVIFACSFAPSVSFAQQPTATIRSLSGTVLVSGQTAKTGAVLHTGDTLQTQAGASVVLVLSDGSTLELGENTRLDLAELSQTAAGARVSRIKLAWGWIRAKLSPGHQQTGSAFDIETPNAIVGVKFSQPDVEVSYDPAKQETIGLAHTVELVVKNLLTGETKLVPVGSTVIITAIGIKVIAGIVGIVGSSSAGTAGTGATSAGTTGVSTGKIVAIGVGVATAAGGIAAIAASSTGGGINTAESTRDLSGYWQFSGSCVARGCTEDTVCPGPPMDPSLIVQCCGINFCNCCNNISNWIESNAMSVSQTGNILSGHQGGSSGWNPTLSGVVNGNSVTFTIQPDNIIPIWRPLTTYTGVINGNTIQGTFEGSDFQGPTRITWSGTFTVTIRKE